jgi:dTDP-3,4-didehydro-2,6-dideoxy-alpha-D-glucose 3-reductase
LKVLLLGYSNIAKKRILNYFKKKKISISLASLSHKDKIEGVSTQYNSYDLALKNSKANIVYISLPNSLHFKWAYKALKLGYHVIVDKPLCDSTYELNKLIRLSFKKKKMLCEATFFNYHSQFNKLIDFIENLKDIKKIKSSFVIPMPSKSSILRSTHLKGGVLMDMGPYASSIARIFFKEKIISKKVIIKKNKTKLVTTLRFLIKYKEKIYEGNFRFGGKYKNELIVVNKKNKFVLNRVFSPPSNEKLNLIVKSNKSIIIKKINKDDCFANFFNEVLIKIKKNEYNFYINQIRCDNYFRNKILKEKKTVKKFL